MDKVMIHACPQRMWYVEEYLVPSLRAQGIEPEVWNDTNGLGNLYACMESFKECGKCPGATWHLQDDVIICHDFAERIADMDGVVCGFACENFDISMEQKGRVPQVFMWYSFPCIRIPNELADAVARWFFDDAQRQTQYAPQIADRKHDDWFFREFMRIYRPAEWVTNAVPNLVDHVDYLIGGTIVNRQRSHQDNRAMYFEDTALVDELAQKIQSR